MRDTITLSTNDISVLLFLFCGSIFDRSPSHAHAIVPLYAAGRKAHFFPTFLARTCLL